MDTINRKLASRVTVDEALSYCKAHRDRFIELATSADEGGKEYDTLIEGVADQSISPSEMPDFGMSDQELQ